MPGKSVLVVDANIFLEGMNPMVLSDRYDIMMTPEVEFEVRNKGEGSVISLALASGRSLISSFFFFSSAALAS